MTLLRRLAVVVAAAGLSLTTAATAPAESARAAESGEPGYCKDSTGVTVVVDFTALGGDVVVRCAPGPVGPGFSGVDALQQAGYRPEGTKRDGLAFVCRIAGRPAADEKLPVEGDEDYTEDCEQTPPASAHWSYWHARDGGRWQLSSTGASSRDAIAGGFEGWSFSLNNESGEPPPPKVAPTRPAASRPSPTASPEPVRSRAPRPSADPSRSAQPAEPRTAVRDRRSGAEPSATTSAPASPARPTSAPASPTRPKTKKAGETPAVPPPSPSGSSDAAPVPAPEPVVTGEVPAAAEEDRGSGWGLLLGLGLAAALGIGAGATAWRRSRRV